MLTRLQVTGFKNLVGVDVRFGPFTCIAGPNGVGKSNLFDAISFLSALANLPLVEAAKSVREGRTADVRSLFHRVGDRHDPVMSFVAEMIVPEHGEDDLGQEAKAATTFLRYSLVLGLRDKSGRASLGELEIHKEELNRITVGESRSHLRFPHSRSWRDSVVRGRRTVPFISTEDRGLSRVEIKLHQDRGDDSGGGRPASRLAASLPRTVLSSTNAAENRTAVLAQREMRSWRRIQLEPSAMREPDDVNAPHQLGSNGAHLAATLYHLANRTADSDESTHSSDVYARIADRLSDLIDDVRQVGVDLDPQRELLTLHAMGKDGTRHPARALSDGTLRFLALATIDQDPDARGVLCLEEPENGIHPERVAAMLRLLRDIATDTNEPIGPDNPLRQVIINTHSPIVVAEAPDDSLLMAGLKQTVRNGERFHRATFACLPDTWRAKAEEPPPLDVVDRGTLLAYLNPSLPDRAEPRINGHDRSSSSDRARKTLRVIDRPDIRQLRFFDDEDP